MKPLPWPTSPYEHYPQFRVPFHQSIWEVESSSSGNMVVGKNGIWEIQWQLNWYILYRKKELLCLNNETALWPTLPDEHMFGTEFVEDLESRRPLPHRLLGVQEFHQQRQENLTLSHLGERKLNRKVKDLLECRDGGIYYQCDLLLVYILITTILL